MYNDNDRGHYVTNEPQRHLRTIPWWISTAGSPLPFSYKLALHFMLVQQQVKIENLIL